MTLPRVLNDKGSSRVCFGVYTNMEVVIASRFVGVVKRSALVVLGTNCDAAREPGKSLRRR